MGNSKCDLVSFCRLCVVLIRKAFCPGPILQQRKFSSLEILLIRVTHQGENSVILSNLYYAIDFVGPPP